MRNFLLVSVDAKRDLDTKSFARTLDDAEDWIRPWRNFWLLWTEESAGDWYRKLKAALEDGEHIFISELDLSNRAGLMPSGVWNFIRSKIE